MIPYLSMAPTIFAEKIFSRILMDVNGYGTVFMDRIRERHWYGLMYANKDGDVLLPRFSNLSLYTH